MLHGDVASARRLAGFLAAPLLPIAVTVALLPLSIGTSRDYVFIYIAVVAALGVAAGLVPALIAAGVSFLLVDWFFVPPLHTLSITDQTDVVNLLVFFGAGGLVGGLGSRRRHTQLRAEALSQQLRRANVDLARLNREQAEAAAVAVRLARTEQQVHALEETDRLRAELLANVSHELRTPLATILTGTSGLLEDPALGAKRGEIESIVGEAERLARLVSDMLDMARIEGHALRLTLAEVDVRDAIAAAAERLARTAPGRRVAVEVDGPLEVIADWDRLGQVLDNLLSNADRHAPPGTPIHVEATPGKRSMVVIRVIDQGSGVAPDQRERIFERFVRSEGGVVAPGAAGGTGLGLAIVRGIVEAHAGRVWVEEPRDGGGARFAFALPAAERSVGAGEDVHVDVDDQANQPPQRT